MSPLTQHLISPELLSDGRYLISADRMGIGLEAFALATAEDVERIDRLLLLAAQRYQPLGTDYAAIGIETTARVWFLELVDRQREAQSAPDT